MRIDVYHYMILFLLVAAGAAMYQSGNFYLQIILIPVAAAAADFGINYYKKSPRFFPLSAVISGLIIASIMPQLEMSLQILLALIAVAQKHVIRWQGRHIFNPAAFTVLAALTLGFAPSWWVATSAVVLIFLLTANMVSRLPISLSFYAVYFLVGFTRTDVLVIDYTAMFFALVMAVEPKTTPIAMKGMIVFGAALALLPFGVQYAGIPADPFIVSLLFMNLFTRELNKLK